MRPSGLSSTRPARTSPPRIPNSTHSRGGLLPSSKASEPRSKRLKRKWRRLQTLSPRASLHFAPALSRLPRPCNRRQRPYSRDLLRRQSPRARRCSRQRPGRDLPSEVGTQTGPDRARPRANRSPYRSHGTARGKDAFDEIGTSQRRNTEVRLPHRWSRGAPNRWSLSRTRTASSSFVIVEYVAIVQATAGVPNCKGAKL